MKHGFRFSFLLFLLVSSGCALRFDGAHFLQHVSYLAGDELEGRGVNTPGIEHAAEYIAREFSRAGLRPAGENDTFFQPFNVTLGQKLTGKSSLWFALPQHNAGEVMANDFTTLPFSSSERFEGPVAFVGYGITNLDANYDDYDDRPGFDPKGRVLLMLRYEPHDADPNAKFGGDTPSLHASFESKARRAREHGAKAILIVNPPMHHPDEGRLFPFDSVEHVQSYGIPMLQIKREVASKLIEAAGIDDLKTLQASLDNVRKPRSTNLLGVVVGGDPGLFRERGTARNVIGVIRGTGLLADEYVVIGAHYDHLGRTIPRGPHPTSQPGDLKPEIHNGADDNASGVAGLIELARIFAAHAAPRRSILFIAFSGEEMGLLGSMHFVNHPAVPLDHIIAMLNMDMIGRLRKDQLQVFGIRTAREFAPLVERESGVLGFDLKTSAGGFGPSDHTSFYSKKIPVLHFFTGVHEDYHRPGDDTDKINAPGGARVVQLIYRIAQAIIAAPSRPAYVAVAESQPSRSGLKVRLGVMPSYAEDDQPGMLIDGVSPGSPAERGGLQGGDRILMVGDHAINNVYDFMDALGRYKPGDEADLTVLRNGQRIKVPVKFEAP